jgi:signal transduction histidine kinase
VLCDPAAGSGVAMKSDVRILLVEDNPTDALMIEQYFLEFSGIDLKLQRAERLREALDQLRSELFDGVILDLGLPDSQGIDTFMAVHRQAPDVPVLVLTGLNDESMGANALQHGAQDYIVKNQIQGPLLNKAIRYAIARSNLQRMERALLQGEKLQALGTLAGGIAHDFNNILLAISGNARLAMEQLPPEHAAYANVLEIAKAGSRATALTKKILSFSRQQETRTQATSVQPVVEEVISLLRATLPARIELCKDFPPGLPPIMADASQIHQIIVNLATNATDAIGDQSGQLELSARSIRLNGAGSTVTANLPPGDYVKLTVKDNGPGIDKQTITRIFEPFFTTKPAGRGTGMGLAIVHGIMKRHMGEITVYSEVGKGTVFHLYFPVAHEAPAELPAAAEPAPEGHGQEVLYLDDEAPLVLSVTLMLKRLGYRGTGFTNPLEALQAFRENPSRFKAIVSDLSMPQMSGMDFARAVLETRRETPIVITTGFLHPQDIELAQTIGVGELLLKPYTMEELGGALHRLLTVQDKAEGHALEARNSLPQQSRSAVSSL